MEVRGFISPETPPVFSNQFSMWKRRMAKKAGFLPVILVHCLDGRQSTCQRRLWLDGWLDRRTVENAERKKRAGKPGGNAMAIRFSDGRWINGVDGGDGSFNNNKTTSANALRAVKSGGAGAVQLLATGAFAGQGGGSGQSFGTGDDASLQIGARFPSP